MLYPRVLGCSPNPILDQYREEYFQKILSLFTDIFLELREYKVFLTLSEDQQKDFLLHPDISSLLQGINRFPKESSLSKKKFIGELFLFLYKKSKASIRFSGEKIKGTNIYLSDKDNNPGNTHIGHPDHDENGMIGWGEKSTSDWMKVMTQALDLLEKIDANFYKELSFIIQKIVPMKTSIDVHNSCSYKDCIGTLYIGYTINTPYPELNILEAIIHESSHNKLNLIMQSRKIHRNDFSEKYYSPYRPDARHIQGVFLGIHAIVPTVYIMLHAIERGYIQDESWIEKIVLYHIKNKLGYNVVKRYMLLEREGESIFQDIGKVISLCDTIMQSSKRIQKVNLSLIQKKAKTHFTEVQANYPYVQY